MVLIDGMLSMIPPRVVCQCTITEDFVFLRDEKVAPVALMEAAAQTAAVYMGIHWQTRHIGFLASCRDAEFYVEEYRIGDVLLVHGELLGETERSGSFECKLFRGDELTARFQLLVVKPAFEIAAAGGRPTPAPTPITG